MLVQYLLSSCVHPSVCNKSVFYIGSRKQRRTIAQGLQFYDAKDLYEILIG